MAVKSLLLILILVVCLASSEASHQEVDILSESWEFQMEKNIQDRFFNYVKPLIAGYFKAYEGVEVKEQCLDSEFQEIIIRKGAKATKAVVTFWKHKKSYILPKVTSFFATLADELTNSCGEGQMFFDLYVMNARSKSILSLLTKLAKNALLGSLHITYWGIRMAISHLLFNNYNIGLSIGHILRIIITGHVNT
ncbi:unnamed protein product [Moneuplotes crassus]|uniref:Uncharacterized protein n=1 Tax=Euplotes crassus TaxID=5936 RepID=A0AAD1XYH3_EUPCR|nr:unnamed protein product [Moneuplotes crassus]